MAVQIGNNEAFEQLFELNKQQLKWILTDYTNLGVMEGCSV